MTRHHNNLSPEDRDMLALWAVSAGRCWLVLSAVAVLAFGAHLLHLA